MLGGVMDELSMMLLTHPGLLPDGHGAGPVGPGAAGQGDLVRHPGADAWSSIGLIAPPVGLNVYVVNNVARDVPMAETYKGVLPFLAWDALRVVLLLLFPAISLGLVHMLFR
ncbi:MAG: TRAP transporter large permease subunit [Comamonadaceae bacterium]|nr:TRAP transporter large permease subunit [Comamonadaceae bacterium]